MHRSGHSDNKEEEVVTGDCNDLRDDVEVVSVVAKINNPGSLDCQRASHPLRLQNFTIRLN